MLATHLVEELGCGTAFSSLEFFESLTDALLDVGEGGEIEEALVGGGILEDGFGFAVDGEDDGALGGFELLEEFGGVVAEGGEGLGVLGGVDHVWVSAWREFTWGVCGLEQPVRAWREGPP